MKTLRQADLKEMIKKAPVAIFSFFILLLACNNTSLQPDSIDTFHFFTSKNQINWSKVEINIPNSEKIAIVQKLKKEFDYFFYQAQYDSIEYGIAGFIKCLHFLDLNNDKNTDVIFEGFSGSESDNTQIFINKNGEFKKVIEVYQYLEAIDFNKANQLSSFSVLDFGCCAEYVETETIYKVDENFTASISFQRAKISGTTPPKQPLFKTPVSFKTTIYDYSLRYEPMIDDTSIFREDIKGNVIARYPKLASGKAWAEQQDDSGRIWYLVEMDAVEKLKGNLVYYRDSIAPREIGWMSKRYLKIEN